MVETSAIAAEAASPAIPTFPSFEVMGVKINAVCVADLPPLFDAWIRARHRTYVVLTGAHGVVEMQDDAELRRINNASGLTTPDGMPVVWIGRGRGFTHIEKVYAPDIMNAVFAAGVARGHRHFLYGGEEGVADALAKTLADRFPGIQVVGTYCPPHRPLTKEERDDVARRIDSACPDVVWCGLGCPKQERWMDEFRPLLEAPILIGVGAGFDFLTGRKRQAPVWIQHSGLEWLYRLVSEPRRLWKRYSRVVPRFIWGVATERFSRLRAPA